MTSTRFPVLQWFAILLMPVGLLYLLAPVLFPFVAAAVLAYICQPLVSRLSTKNRSRTLATLMVMLGMLAIFVLMVLILMPLLRNELDLLWLRLPSLLESVQARLLPFLQQSMPEAKWDMATLKNVLSENSQVAGGVAGKLLPWLTGGGAALLGLVMNLMLIPLAMFYLLRDWPELLAKVDALIPRRWHDKSSEIAKEIDEVLGQFLRGQIAVMLLMSVFYVFALWLVGVEFALPIGMVSGLLVFIPYVGMIVGVALATVVALSQFELWTDVVWVWMVFGVGQLLEGMVVTPRLVGERIGLHPLAVVFALLAFGQLFGFVGLLIALPLAAVLLVGLRHLRSTYLSSELYK
ncbi:MAG: AI-2E family transporter [Gallionellaceae bacterium]